jgi:hypothetical protein
MTLNGNLWASMCRRSRRDTALPLGDTAIRHKVFTLHHPVYNGANVKMNDTELEIVFPFPIY